MPITRIYEGNILHATTQTVVNTVNCVGAMGKGIALEFKKHDPVMFKAYKGFCDQNNSHRLTVGKLWLWKHSTPWWILNFPTKDHWRDKSQLSYLRQGLQNFVDTYKQRGITSITFGQLGCQNGGLNWDIEVLPMMREYLDQVDIPVEIVIYVGK